MLQASAQDLLAAMVQDETAEARGALPNQASGSCMLAAPTEQKPMW